MKAKRVAAAPAMKAMKAKRVAAAPAMKAMKAGVPVAVALYMLANPLRFWSQADGAHWEPRMKRRSTDSSFQDEHIIQSTDNAEENFEQNQYTQVEDSSNEEFSQDQDVPNFQPDD